ncbi:MAG: hypothetical protein O2890_02195 [Cyanobacteria bacterium]|nr:hypothetical protein [Cyanobacteriota bacterium]MDA0865228.1 hypothetical protein [Cyanobacteriota bacterium]
MNELDELICKQASYSVLVAFIQKQQGCNYLAACTQLNEVLKQYRFRNQPNPT